MTTHAFAHAVQTILASSDGSEAARVSESIAPIFIVGIVFSITAAIVAMSLYAAYRAKRLRYETLRFAIEKGAPIPDHLFLDGRPRTPDPLRDLRRGLVLTSLGAGLCLFLGIQEGTNHNGVWSVGFVPGMLGIGFLATWWIARPRSASASSPGTTAAPAERP